MKPKSLKLSFVSVPIYPVLLSAYPILSLLTYNIGEILPGAILRPLVVATLLSVALIGVLRIFLRDLQKAAFVAGIWLLLFFTYGHLRILLPGAILTRPAVLTPLWLGLFILSFITTYLSPKSPQALSFPLNAIWLMLIAFTVSQMLSYQLRAARRLEITQKTAQTNVTLPSTLDSAPDIYYFILDSYTRADTLQTIYGYDNSEFLNKLESMGFYIASCSQSNFDRTELSLASSLNLDYLQTLEPMLTPDVADKLPLWALMQHSVVRQILEDQGYQTVAFATGYPWSELRDADQFIQPDLPFAALSEFEVLLLRTTFMSALQHAGLVDFQVHESRRFSERTRLILDRLPSLSAQNGPQFYFVHILEPHPPFVFNADGANADASTYINAQGKYTSESYARGYISEVEFINREMLKLVHALIENSSIQPVIIIQGDHGPWLQPSEYTMPILNAYYLPNHTAELYPTISPVNTFRIVFNAYLGTSYTLLEDLSYDSPNVELYDYSFVPNHCP